MSATPEASRLRQRLHALGRERDRLEESVLYAPQRPLRGTLIARHLGTPGSYRASLAHYLCRLDGGRRRQLHVTKALLAQVEAGVDAWRSYQSALSRWRAIDLEMAGLFDELLLAQEEPFPP